MSEIVRDPLWQFIGAALTLMTIIVAILLYWLQRRRKALSYEIVTSTPLLSVEEEIKGRVQILFDNKPIKDVHLIVVRIINSGNLPIVSADYEFPVSLSFGENSQILSCEVSETNPNSLQVTFNNIENTKVVLTPVLLNSGDAIALKMLVSQFEDRIFINGRIVGVKNIQKFVEGRIPYFILSFGGMSLAITGMILSFWFPLPPSFEMFTWTESWPLLVLLGLALMSIGMLKRFKKWRLTTSVKQ